MSKLIIIEEPRGSRLVVEVKKDSYVIYLRDLGYRITKKVVVNDIEAIWRTMELLDLDIMSRPSLVKLLSSMKSWEKKDKMRLFVPQHTLSTYIQSYYYREVFDELNVEYGKEDKK